MNTTDFPDGSEDLNNSFEANLRVFDEDDVADEDSDEEDISFENLAPDTGCQLAIRPMMTAQCEVNSKFVRLALEKLPDDVLVAYRDAASIALEMQVTPTRDHFLEAFDELGWAYVAGEGSVIDYVPAICDEVHELMRSNSVWKFWKSPRPAPDHDNQLVELVDILHFLMSHTLVCVHTIIQVESSEDDGAEVARIPDAELVRRATDIASVAFAYERQAIDAQASPTNPLVAKDATIAFLNRVTSTDFQDDADVQVDLWRSFWSMVYAYGFKLSDLELVYTAKVALNHFRISKGDATGNYRRIWADGREDNAHLMDFIRAGHGDSSEIDQECVLSFLNTAYESN